MLDTLSAVLGAELGPLILNTDVELFGRRNDKRYHLGGAAADILFGVRIDWARLFLAGEVKLGRAFVLDALTLPQSRAEHAYWLLIGVVGAGVTF